MRSRIPTSKAGRVLSVDDGEGETVEDGEEDIDWEAVEELLEQSEEEQARAVFDELRGSKPTLSLVEFLRWEDVQELLESGALSKDNLASAIESAGVTVESDSLGFDTVRFSQGDSFPLPPFFVKTCTLTLLFPFKHTHTHTSNTVLRPNSNY